MKSVSANLEVDGVEEAPVVHLVFSRPREEEGGQVDDLEVEIKSQGRVILTGNVEYSTVYVEWGLRRPHLITGQLSQ